MIYQVLQVTTPLSRHHNYTRSATVTNPPPPPSRKYDQWDVCHASDVDNWETSHFALADKLWMTKAQSNTEHLTPVTPQNNPSYLSRSSHKINFVDGRPKVRPQACHCCHYYYTHLFTICWHLLLPFKSTLLVEWLFKLACTVPPLCTVRGGRCWSCF
jgi:hypothetical protein